MDNQQIKDLRLRLLENGYSPIRNRDKACYMPGWPTIEITPELIDEWKRRNSRDSATGLRVENGLAVIDIDINDEDMANAVAEAIFDVVPQLADQETPLLVRHGKGFKEAWFVRTEELFGRIHTRRWTRPGETNEDGTHVLEIFGGGAARQFGAFGWHTVDAIEYQWPEASPADTPLDELPILTKAQFFAIADRTEQILQAAGWEPVLKSTSGENTVQRVYDLTDDLVFDVHEGDRGISMEALKALADAEEETVRVSASWLEGPDPKRSTDRCLVSITRTGHLAIWDSATGTTHVEEIAKPQDYGPEIDRIAEKLKELQERRKLKIKTADDMMTAVAKMREVYAYCPMQDNDVVPVWTNSAESGKKVAKFRLEMLPNSMEEIGPRGGKKRVNPVDVWLASEQRLTVAGVRMRPDQPRPIYEEDGVKYINCYDPPLHVSDGGEAQTGLEFLTHLIPNKVEREWFLDWLAFKLRYPHIPGPAVVMVAHQTYGTGRGTLGILLGKLFGAQYVRNVPFTDFTGRTYQSQYNEWQADALFVMVNESSESDGGSSYQTKRNTYEHLKEIVDPRPTLRSVKVKREKNFVTLSSTTFLIATNHADALPIPEHDRRFCVIQNGGAASTEFWARINRWIERPENVAALFDVLMARDLSDYSPFAPPPMFEGKEHMVAESRSDLDEAADILLANLNGELLVPAQIEAALRQIRTNYGLSLPDPMERGVRALIKQRLRRIGHRNGSNWFQKFENNRMPVYAVTTAAARKWTEANSDDVRRELLRNGSPSGSGLPGNLATLMSKLPDSKP